MSNQLILQQARQLIEQKRFDEARTLLQQLPGDQTAIRWLAHLDKIAPHRNSPTPPQTGQFHSTIACPECQMGDMTQKVPSIVAGEVKSTGGVINYSPADVAGMSGLAKSLLPPEQPYRPEEPDGLNARRTHLYVMAFMYMGLWFFVGFSIWTCLLLFTGSDAALCLSALIVPIGMLAIIYMTYRGVKNTHIEEELAEDDFQIIWSQYVKRYQVWEKAMPRWEEALYCRRCNVAYIPGENIAVPPGEFKNALMKKSADPLY